MITKLTMVIPLNPITKKNNSQICYNARTGKPFIMPSKKYKQYEKDCGVFIKGKGLKIDYPVNLKALYYRKDKRKVDLSNLHEALQDILVKYGVLKDDNFTIIQSHDGSRVLIDRENPRTEIVIEKVETQ